MARDFYDPATMVVREPEEIIEELRKMIVSKLPGNRERKAVWTTVNEAWRIISFAKIVLDEEKEKGRPSSDHPALSNRTWEYHGQVYAATCIIRRVADEMGVSNFKTREKVEDVQVGEG